MGSSVSFLNFAICNTVKDEKVFPNILFKYGCPLGTPCRVWHLDPTKGTSMGCIKNWGYHMKPNRNQQAYISQSKAGSELADTATATAGSPRHHALKYRTPLATPMSTVVAAAVATNSDPA